MHPASVIRQLLGIGVNDKCYCGVGKQLDPATIVNVWSLNRHSVCQ